MSVGWLIALVLTIAVTAIAVRLCIRFRRDRRAARDRLQNFGSRVIETEQGSIEYVSIGEGYPVLVIHGIFGGIDQGIVSARNNLGEGFRAIIPSRFGYLRTPMPGNASPALQADAFASLLAELNIDKAAVIGYSAGGTSAIQFALRHPERCSALVLISSNAPSITKVNLPPKPVAKLLFKCDLIFWILITFFRSAMITMMGVPKGFELTPEYEADIEEMMKNLLPVSPRAAGAIFDMYVSNPDINRGYPFEKISVPTLIVNAKDDPLARYKNARSLAERIPGAKLLTIENGGHLLLGHGEKIRAEIKAFLDKAIASGT